MFSNESRCLYKKSQLAEVICQLRFPRILSIGTEPPAKFQEQIRHALPQYTVRKEAPAPKIKANQGQFSLEQQPQTINHQFMSADGVWRVNLTDSFISLACTRYTCWEDFAAQLDKPLAAFIQVYQPAYFERIGLRYLNFFSRKSLSLEGTPFSELIQSPYLGLMQEEDVPEHTVAQSTVNAELSIRGGCKVKIHAGPGLVKQNGQQDKEIRFIFDQDLFMPGNVPVNMSAGALQTLHGQAYSIFRGAITDTMHDALEPTDI